jgi:hypothetical protein
MQGCVSALTGKVADAIQMITSGLTANRSRKTSLLEPFGARATSRASAPRRHRQACCIRLRPPPEWPRASGSPRWLPPTARETTTVRDQPRTSMAGSGASSGTDPRAPRPRLRLVYRLLRYARSEGSQNVAQRAFVVSTPRSEISVWLEKLGMSESRRSPRMKHLQAGRSARCGTFPVALSPISALFGMLNLAIVPDR